MKRIALSKKTRFEVFKRDSFTCQYCGNHPPAVVLNCDHIIAVASGGNNDMDNLVTSCEDCNQGKGARDLKVAPITLAEKADRIAEAEDQLKGFQRIFAKRRKRIEKDSISVLNKLLEGDTLNKDWFRSTKMFVEKLGYEECMDSAEKTLRKNIPMSRIFAYFCGINWSKIRALEGK